MGSLLSEKTDHRFAVQYRVFAQGVEENAAQLGITLGEAAELMELGDTLEQALGDVATAKAALAAAVTEKEAALKRAQRAASEKSAQFRANPAVDDGLLSELGLAPKHVPPVRRGPQTPQRLSLSANGNGEITLTWDRAGCPRGTVFMVQQSPAPNGPWETVEVTSRIRAKILGTPGTPIWLRVAAKIRNEVSNPGLPVSVWACVSVRRAA